MSTFHIFLGKNSTCETCSFEILSVNGVSHTSIGFQNKLGQREAQIKCFHFIAKEVEQTKENKVHHVCVLLGSKTM